MKRKALGPCSACGFRPLSGNITERALSLYFSTECEDPRTGELKEAREIRAAAEKIRLGHTLQPPECEINELITKLLEFERHDVPWWKVMAFLLALALLALSPVIVGYVLVAFLDWIF